MHQHPRPPPREASPASSPTTNPYRTNNPREGSEGGHSRFNSEVPSYNESDDGGIRGDSVVVSGPSVETKRKLDQIIQNFHTKAATVILQSRMALPTIRTKDQTTKVNKWFQLETDDTDAFREELRIWKTCGGFENRPPPLIIETYLDTSDLSNKQSLVIVDRNGKHWDVAEALNDASGSKSSHSRERRRHAEVVLERWRIELKNGPTDDSYDYGAILPTIYKKSIVFFRSLYATTRFTPVSKFVKTIGKIPSTRGGGLRVNCRVINGEEYIPAQHDMLTMPLYPGNGEVTNNFFLGETESPAGSFTADVCYRNDCNFRVEDSETLLSERFMGDEDFFQPTLASRRDDRRRDARTTEIGSLPAHRRFSEEAEPTQTYGSLSTFHGEAPPMGASPISALRAARNMGSDAGSPPVGSSYSRPAQTARPSKALESIAMARRPSVSFNPFKAGSLSGSPLPSTSAPQGEILPPGSPRSLNRNLGASALTQPRNRSSLTAGMPASLRGAPVAPENVTSSASSSPKPAPISRYSSSFSHRRGRLSYGGASKAEDDQGSSGKQSFSSSSAQPGSGILAEATVGSSGSLHTDDDNISDFLKVLDINKNLPSFQQNSNDASTRRTTSQLTRFQSMRESHNILTESLSSSMLLHRSSISSSRQLSSVPPMVAATSVSTSSSPGGKPVSPHTPHTPHTPAIPSRLSANSIVDYTQPQRFRTSSRAEETRIEDVSSGEDEGPGTTAIDIPMSPGPYQYHNRRSSSVAQQQRTLAVDDDLSDLPFHRSISLGADDREPPSLSDLRGFGQTVADETSRERVLQPAAEIQAAVIAGRRQCPDREGPQVPLGLVPGVHHPKLGRGVGRGISATATGSSSSVVADSRGTGSGSSDRPSRHSFTRPQGMYDPDDEYPLLFDMSELGRNTDQSRRSLEEGRGGGTAGADSTGRGGFESSRGGGDSGQSSRRGSHRGW